VSRRLGEKTMTGTVAETGLAWLAHASWQAAVLGLLVFLVAAALRERLAARWRYGLWLVVLARLALPVTPPAPWSLFRLTPGAFTGSAPSRTAEAPVAGSPATAFIPVAVAPTAGTGATANAVPAPVSGRAERQREEPEATPGTTGLSLAAAWLAGVCILLVRQGWLHVRLRWRRQTWCEISDPLIRDLFERCREELGVVRSVRLLAAPGGCGPAAWGVCRPCIVLPESLLAELSAEELRLVLLHELTHVRRRDVLFDRVAALLVAVHWFNPVAWLALAGLRRERELACDEAVLDHAGGCEAARYGHVLLKVADQLAAWAALPGAVGVFGKGRYLVRRIHMIADYRKPTAAGKVLGGLLLLTLAAFGLTDAAAEPALPGVPEPTLPATNADNEKTLTVAGVCQDEDGKPLAEVRVVLYREDYRKLKAEQLRAEVTGGDGRFEFRELAPLPAGQERAAWWYAVVVTKSGRGSLVRLVSAESLKNPLLFKLRPAATLEGRVTDPGGKPVAGAHVWALGLITGPVEGLTSTRTDADGRFALTDMNAWGPDALKPRPAGNGTFTALAGCHFDVLHPNYGHERPMYRSMPATVNVVLQPAGILDGQVVDRVTGKPAAGVLVSMQGISETAGGPKGGGSQQTRTDASGKYRFTSLWAGKYNVWADAPDRACTALDSFAVEAGKTHTAPDLALVEGGWIEGCLVEADTGKPLGGRVKEGRLHVGLYGPARPKSGAAPQSSPVDDHGRFRLHVAPGVNYPYLMPDYWERTQRREYFEKGIEVRPGEVASVTFRVLPAKPIPDPEPAPVRLPVPVAAERPAAARIRDLGGWYALDAEQHVVEVNMVYHETPDGRRFDNDRTDTDEALRTVNAFPRLKKLFLHKGQATDDGLQALAPLKGLEVLFVWDAEKITDAGIGRLAGLTQLNELHFSSGQLGDGSLAVFGRMRGLRHLSLQGNAFRDDGLKRLAGLKQLRTLWIGMNRGPITDAGARHLAGLTALEQLDLQQAQLSDAGVAALKALKQLREVYLNGAPGSPLTDASVEPLLGLTKLQHLGLNTTRLTDQGVRRLLALPDLKDLSVSSSATSEGLRDELKQQHPGLKLYLSRPR
jgi:beta-lactamase regulating signal transducer with metallopeptidase domain/5-hydroxyisourate hydrolase-like protein (transthyretin family)